MLGMITIIEMNVIVRLITTLENVLLSSLCSSSKASLSYIFNSALVKLATTTGYPRAFSPLGTVSSMNCSALLTLSVIMEVIVSMSS